MLQEPLLLSRRRQKLSCQNRRDSRYLQWVLITFRVGTSPNSTLQGKNTTTSVTEGMSSGHRRHRRNQRLFWQESFCLLLDMAPAAQFTLPSTRTSFMNASSPGTTKQEACFFLLRNPHCPRFFQRFDLLLRIPENAGEDLPAVLSQHRRAGKRGRQGFFAFLSGCRWS